MHLSSLNLSDNGIRLSNQDGAILRSLTQLQALDLSNNNICQIPITFSKMGALRSLNLSGNKLSELALIDMEALEELYLDYNHFDRIPLGIQIHPNLRFLTLHGNPFPFSELKNLLVSLAVNHNDRLRIVADGQFLQNMAALKGLRTQVQAMGMDLMIEIPQNGHYSHHGIFYLIPYEPEAQD